MKYLAILRQEGGCDYTIGCGINTIIFEAESVKDASEKLKEIIRDNYASDDYKLKSANFYEIKSSYEVDLNLWYDKINTIKATKEAEEERKIELAEFERIKNKYKL